MIGFQLLLAYHRPAVATLKFSVFQLIPEQGFQAGHFKAYRHALFQPFNQLGQSHALGIPGLQRCAHGGEEVGVFRVHGGFFRKFQGTDESGFQLRQEVQGAAQKSDGAPYGLAAGETRDGLVHHRLKNGCRQVRPGGALVDQGLNVGFGKYPAPGGNGVDLLVILRRFIEARGIGLQKGCHLVDEGAGAPGADAVHPFLQAALKIDDFCVLTPQLNGHIRLGRHSAQCRCHGDNLLDKADVHGLPQIDGPGAGDFGLQDAVSQLLPGLFQERSQSLLSLGVMASVLTKNNLIIFIQHNQFHCG